MTHTLTFTFTHSSLDGNSKDVIEWFSLSLFQLLSNIKLSLKTNKNNVIKDKIKQFKSIFYLFVNNIA